MSATVNKTITTALWVYQNPEGKRRIGYRGEKIELTAAEAERGQKEGVFDQPPAGTVTPGLPHDVRAENFANIYDVIEPRVATPPSDDVVAALHHDIQAPPVSEPEATADAATADAADPPSRDANKPEIVKWVADNLCKDDGSDFSKAELNRMNKDELWDLIDAPEEA